MKGRETVRLTLHKVTEVFVGPEVFRQVCGRRMLVGWEKIKL